VGCEASEEFRFLSASALKIFDRAVAGMSWYEYSRHATSVLVYYLRGYDCLLQQLDERGLIDELTLEQLVGFTNGLYEGWPLRKTEASDRMNSLDILSTDIPVAERIMYLALDTWFLRNLFAEQLRQTRDYVRTMIEGFGRSACLRVQTAGVDKPEKVKTPR
jgi:hypothetical protein